MPQDRGGDNGKYPPDLQHQIAHDQTRIGERPAPQERVVGPFPAQVQVEEH